MRILPLFLLIVAVLGCEGDWGDERPMGGAAIEEALQKATNQPRGDYTKADLEKVTSLYLFDNKITDLTPLMASILSPFLPISTECTPKRNIA